MSRTKRRVERRVRRHPALLQPRHGKSLGNLLENVAKAFTPVPYNEREAAVDALSGKEACPHGQWPHQKAICALCAAEVAVKVVAKVFEKKAS